VKEKLRVKFVDFWVDMNDEKSNFFYKILSKNYHVEFSDTPDVLFYSHFGTRYMQYPCTRILYSPENIRPDFSKTDYAISFDFLDDPRHLRMPLWALYYKNEFAEDENLERKFEEWQNRKNFCCIVVSNEHAKERIDFYKNLNAKIKVDSAGRWNNNIGKELLPGTDNKLDFIKDYRFVISFENSSYPGYTTEKLIEPLMAGCIPIYWGDPQVGLDFNLKRFISVAGIHQFDDTVKRVIEIENNKILAKDILKEPIFANNKIPVYLRPDYMDETMFSWIEEARQKRFKGVGSGIKQRMKYFIVLSKSRLKSVKNKIA